MVREHLQTCPLMMQMAVLLSQPMWEREFTPEVTWPTPEVLLEIHRQRANRQWQFQAPLSDTADDSLMFLAHCAKHFLADAWMIQHMSHGCLICGQQFFSRWKFLNHLMDSHNYHQYMTEKLHHLLVMIHPSMQCHYCGSTSHASAIGKRCVVLFNLATALCNGLGIGRDGRTQHGPSSQHLAKRPHSGSASAAWPWQQQREQRSSSSRPYGQKAQRRQGQADADPAQRVQSELQFRSLTDHGEAHPPAGGHTELPADGTSVPGPHQCGQWKYYSRPHPGHADMESRSQLLQGSPSTSTGIDNDDGLARQSSQIEPIPDQRRGGQGMLAPQRSESEHGDAVPEVECSSSTPGAHSRQMSTSAGGLETPGRNASNDGGQCHHGEVPLDAAHGGHANTSDAVVVDGIVKDQSGTLASDQISDFSFMLAAGPMPGEKPQHAAFSPCPAAEQTGLKPRLVRLLLNPSSTLCYANAALQCLVWVGISCSQIIDAAWNHSYGLIDALTTWIPVPLTLYDFAPFQGLFNGGDWGLREKDRQNDLNDFTSHILMLMAPRFVNNFWMPQPALLPGLEGTALQNEKGHALQPIILSLNDTSLDCCTFSDLIHKWHDNSGLCRAFVEAPVACCFSLDRHIPSLHVKHQQRIDLQDGQLQLPFFTGSGIGWKNYRAVAVALHIGHNPASGHWRAALAHRCKWFVYDDGRLPEQMPQLTQEIQRQISQVWFLACEPDRTPMADAARAAAETAGTAL